MRMKEDLRSRVERSTFMASAQGHPSGLGEVQDRCRVHAFSGWCVMGTRVSASMVRPLVVLGFLFGVQSPSLAQAPVPAASAEPVPAVHGTPESKLIQSVTFTPVVAFAGADLRVVVRVTPDAGNRRLQLSIDAPTFYASTERQLDGMEGARAHTFSVKELPAGDYQIVATLEGSSGVRSRVTRSFKVMGEDDSQLQQQETRPAQRRRGRGTS
ncbi:hypothetical protein LuPra_04567 [Luteitalea pratensis]|uniref:YtkA-like domain-containing protein n=2 Tax=Luteitalea pratensis TaxID=1855912 RepID=A0A143PRH6_LUTPR|nr:hypothetical protein LuPra_04567 [Luteitalea pratensis]